MKTVHLVFFAAVVLASMAWTRAALAQTVYGIDSGVTSISLHKAVFDSLGFGVSGTAGATTPFAGYEVGFNIETSANPKDRFCFTLDPFSPGQGIIEHTGTIELNSSINIGNFEIAFDAGRSSADNSGFFITDRVDLDGQILFDIGNPVSKTINGTEFTLVDSDLLVAPEFATFLGSPGFAGADAGDLRIDALAGLKPVPEPSTVVLAALGGMFLALRRRKSDYPATRSYPLQSAMVTSQNSPTGRDLST